MRPRVFAALATIGAVCGAAVPVQVSGQAPLETTLKAAIVSKFPQFVEWPAGAGLNRFTLALCVLDGDPVGPELRGLVADEAVDGRPFTVQVVDREEQLDRCDVLYVDKRGMVAHHTLVRRAISLPILTVSDDPRFLELGGIVRLRQVNGRIRFDVNTTAAQRAGLRISAQLLQLALTVQDGPP